MKTEWETGQTVWVKLTGNAGRGKTGSDLIQKWMITKIGRKYIYAGRNGTEVCFEKREYGLYDGKFVNKTDCCIDYILYKNRQDIEDELEGDSLYHDISDFFRFNRRKLTLEQLRKIKTVLDGKESVTAETENLSEQ